MSIIWQPESELYTHLHKSPEGDHYLLAYLSFGKVDLALAYSRMYNEILGLEVYSHSAKIVQIGDSWFVDFGRKHIQDTPILKFAHIDFAEFPDYLK